MFLCRSFTYECIPWIHLSLVIYQGGGRLNHVLNQPLFLSIQSIFSKTISYSMKGSSTLPCHTQNTKNFKLLIGLQKLYCCQISNIKSLIINKKSLIFNKKSLIFNKKSLIFNKKSFIFNKNRLIGSHSTFCC